MPKVKLRVNTLGAKRGEEIEVDADTAKHLIENGNAAKVKPAPKSDKG